MSSKYLDDFETFFAETRHELSLVLVERHESGGFGNGYIIYKYNDLRVRLVSDRGIFSIDIAGRSKPSEWFNLTLIANYMNKRDLTHVYELSELAEFLKLNYNILVKMFSIKYKETIQILHQLQKEFSVRALDQARTGNVQEYWRTGKINK